jgi:hypothetical protein
VKFNGGRARLGAILAMSVMMLIAAQPAFAATTKVGAKLGTGTFPSNAYPGTYCDHEIDGGSSTYACTWILLNAFGGGSPTAPKNGSINKVKWVNGQGGSFKFVIARKNGSGQFKVISRSTTINYSTDPCDPVNCSVRSKTIAPQAIQTGDYVGIQAAKSSMLRCDSGGNKIALFTPVLNPGGGYTTPTDYSGCFLLLTAVYSS